MQAGVAALPAGVGVRDAAPDKRLDGAAAIGLLAPGLLPQLLLCRLRASCTCTASAQPGELELSSLQTYEPNAGVLFCIAGLHLLKLVGWSGACLAGRRA